MDRFDDIHSEPGATAIRRDANLRTTFDAAGQRKDILLEGKVISMSAEGSIDCATTTFTHSHHCGHLATEPIGHICAEEGCARISCKVCSANARCARCFKPLCLEHVQQLVTPKVTTNLCEGCKAAVIRKQRWTALLRFVCEPFIDFDSPQAP